MVLRHIKHSSPAWWRAEHAGHAANVLSPVSWLYNKVARTKGRISRSYQAKIPVVCVGNFTMGGAGKTPVVINLAQRLSKQGLLPAIITRGYLGKERGPLRTNAQEHSATEVGDEALLLAQYAPTIVAKNRAEGAWLIEHRKNDVILLDDGFQNPSLSKDLSIIVVDGDEPFGNGKVFPAGPLRLDLEDQLDKVDAIVISGYNGNGQQVDEILRVLDDHGKLSIPVLLGRLHARFDEDLKDKPLYAYCGIGKPQKFFDTLEGLGANIARTRSFPDHHNFSIAEATELLDEARRNDWTLITTEKDWVRIPTSDSHIHRALRRQSKRLPVAFEFEKESLVDLDDVLSNIM